MGIHLLSPDNANTQLGLRSILLTLAVVTPLMALFAWFNMALRMGLSINPQVFMGPIIFGFIMSLAIAAINTFNFLKIHAIEELKSKELNDTQIEVILTLY